jgi:septal ring factor EnvC (AmiA/AmiB activator)
MSDALSIFQQPHPPAFSPTDAADLARLRETERQRTEARISALETSLADLTERYADLADRLDALEAAATPAPAKGAAAKPAPKAGAASDDAAAPPADDDGTLDDDGDTGSGSGRGAAKQVTINPLRGPREVQRSVIKKVI